MTGQGALLSRGQLMDRFGTRSASIGSVTVSMTALPAGPLLLAPAPASEPRALDLVLPVDAPLVVRDRTGNQHLVGRRSLTWLPGWLPAGLYTACPGEVAWVRVPDVLLDERSALAAPLPPAPAPASALIDPVRAFVQTAVADELALEPIAARLFDELLVGMLEALVLEARGVAPLTGGVRPPLRMQAIAHISAFRDSPALSPQQIARSLRISVRQLQRAFEEAGTTVAAEIRRQRLEAAVEMLTDDRFDALSIADVAGRAGFRNDAELRRALGADGGTTPSQLRGRRVEVS